MMRSKLIMTMLLFCAVFSTEVFADNLLKNSEFTFAEGKPNPNNWGGTKEEATYKQITTDLPEGVKSGLEATVTKTGKYMGFILQNVALKSGKPVNMVFSAYIKSDINRDAYIQVKLYKDKKQISQFNSPVSFDKWRYVQVPFNTGDADRLAVLLRWNHGKEENVGKKTYIADPKLTAPVKTVALAGDSIVADYITQDVQRGWGQMLPKYLKDSIMVYNMAICGRSTKTFINKGNWEKLLAIKPDFVMIQFGHNDSHGAEKPESTKADGEYRDNLLRMIKDVKGIGATPILVSPPHRRVFSKDGKLSESLKPYRDQMKKVAEETQTTFIDLYDLSEKKLMPLGENGSKPLYCSLKDRTHFSIEGASMIAEMIVQELGKTDSPIKEYILEIK